MTDSYDLDQTLVDYIEAESLEHPIEDVDWSLRNPLYVGSSICPKRLYLDPFLSPFGDIGAIVGGIEPPRSFFMTVLIYIGLCPIHLMIM